MFSRSIIFSRILKMSEQKLNLCDFDCLKANCPVYPLASAETIWISSSEASGARGSYAEWTPDTVKQKFAKKTCFAHIDGPDIYTADITGAYADRYGGKGIGPNAGAARTVTIDGFQVKGVGKTSLLGIYERDLEWHYYGGMSLVDGVLEAINSEAFGHILPVGVVRSRALIYTGPDTAYLPLEDWGSLRGPGALLIRDTCIRPAHFLRADNLHHKLGFLAIQDDVNRTRLANRKLNELFKDTNGVIDFFSKFLLRCANQFAFSKLFRIWHGVLTPSNISIDGRWVDLTNVSFIPSGMNFSLGDGQIPFESEASSPLDFIGRLVDSYAKYNFLSLDVSPLESYYEQAFDTSLRHYLPAVLGLKEGLMNDAEGARAVDVVLKELLVNTRSGSHGKVIFGAPNYYAEDPIEPFLEAIIRRAAGLDGEMAELSEQLQLIFKYKYSQLGERPSYKNFLIGCGVTCLRQLFFSKFFQSGRLISRIVEMAERNKIDAFGDYVNHCSSLSRWIFQWSDEKLTYLYKSESACIAFDRFTGVFFVTENSAPAIESASAAEAFAWVSTRAKCSFVIDHFDFRPGLLRILGLATDIAGTLE